MGNETKIPLPALTAEREKAKLNLAEAQAKIAELEAKLKGASNSNEEDFELDIDPMDENFNQSLVSLMSKMIDKKMSVGINNFQSDFNTKNELKSVVGKYAIFNDEDKSLKRVADLMLNDSLANKGDKTIEDVVKEVAESLSKFKSGQTDTGAKVETQATIPPSGSKEATHLVEPKEKAKTWEEAEKRIDAELLKKKNSEI